MLRNSLSTSRRSVSRVTRCFSGFGDGGRGGGGRGGGRGRGGGYGRGGGIEGRGRGDGGGRGRGGRGRGEGGGRSGSAFDRFRAGQSPGRGSRPHRGGPPKENFAERVLAPAAHGILDNKHSSGIPRLAARQGKSHKVHDPYPGREADEVLRNTYGNNSDYSDNADSPQRQAAVAEMMKLLKPEFVDDEDDYDDFDLGGFDADNHPDITRDGENYIVDFHPENWPDMPTLEDDDTQAQQNRRPMGGPQDKPRSAHEIFFDRDHFDFENNIVPDIPKEIANQHLPLDIKGPNFEDFLEAQYTHPSKYAELRRYNHHPESLREPKPNFPKNRAQPTEEFVKAHMRFLYVTGLPHHVSADGEVGDFENPIHRLEVAKTVADMVGVKVESISPANMTSAFVGYKDKHDLYAFLKDGPKYNTFDRPAKISLYEVKEGDESGFTADDAVVKLEGVPAGISIPRLAQTIFPIGTELREIYGPLTVDDVKRSGATTVLVRMKSAESAKSAVSSAMVIERVERLGHSTAQFFRARRELIYAGRKGPNKCFTYYKQGLRLAAECDTPPKNFYQSHAGVLQLRNVDKSLTKEEISKYFEAYSDWRRDIDGSIYFTTCAQNERTDIVYVGFDLYGEAEEVCKATNGLVDFGKGPVTLRIVKEIFNPDAKNLRESRPERPTEELLATLEWETYVDPEALKELEALGISKDIVADFFRSMRFNNTSYGHLDQGLNCESIKPREGPIGQSIRDTMQLYIETLKEVILEDQGITYEEVFTFPEGEYEEGDVKGSDLVAMDAERLAKLTQKRKTYFDV